jgi:hypothetical protein
MGVWKKASGMAACKFNINVCGFLDMKNARRQISGKHPS